MIGYTPEIENPYPEGPGGQITDFEYVSPLVLYRFANPDEDDGDQADAAYVVERPYSVEFKLDGNQRVIEVPQGMLTDLASVPWYFRWLVSRVGPHLEASIVHDYLFIAWQDIDDYPAQRKDFDFANELMRHAMIEAGVKWWRRALILFAVRIVGWGVYLAPNPEPRYVVVPGP